MIVAPVYHFSFNFASMQVATEKLEAAVVHGMSSSPTVTCAKDMVRLMNVVLELLQ